MQINCRRTTGFVVIIAVMTLVGMPRLVLSASAAESETKYADDWENISEAFTTQLGVNDIVPEYLRRCIGLIVTPTGDIVIQTANKGICISKDQGAHWSVVADNKITGRCDDGFSFSIGYPYDGRMAIFCYDGAGGVSGGMTLDGAKTWSPFVQVNRGVMIGDIDWNARDPHTIFGLTHEPFFTYLSDDGGENWQRVDKSESGSGPEQNLCLGVINDKTFFRADPAKQGGIIELSTDSGQSWNKVANFQVQGRRPVHYGSKVYWTTTKGVITTTNGRDWALIGAGAENACGGPYFGSSDQEFVVVTDRYFLKTEDGGKTWQPIAKFFKVPGVFHDSSQAVYYGWDPRHDILYASGLGTAVYRLKVIPPVETGPLNYADFSNLRGNYGKGSTAQQGDLNHDHLVDYADLKMMLPRLSNLTPAQQQEVDAFAKAHHMPVAADAQSDVWEDVPKNILLPVTDDKEHPLTCQVITPAAHGTVAIKGIVATYTPAGDYTGDDAFTWKASDGNADSAVRTVRLTVNDPYECLPPGDATLDGEVTVADFEVAKANYGKGMHWYQGHFFAGGVVDYRDLLILRDAMKNLTADQRTAFTVFLQEHDTPTVQNMVGKTRSGQSTSMTLSAADDQQPHETSTYRITRPPQHGKAIISGQTLSYTAESGFVGTDDFLYQAKREKRESNEALVTVRVVARITGPSIGVAMDWASAPAKLLEQLSMPTIARHDVLAAMADGRDAAIVADATPGTLEMIASHPKELGAYTAKGGWLILWGLNPGGLPDFNRIVGVDHLIRPFTVEAVGLPTRLDPLLNGMHADSMNMFAGQGVNGISLRAGNVWSYVLDDEDIAPFSKIPPSTYWRPGIVTGPGTDQYSGNLVNGMVSDWQLGFTIPTTKPDYLKWDFVFPRAETVAQFSLTPDTTYRKIKRIRISFLGSSAQPLEFSVQPSMTRQDFPVSNVRATGVNVEIFPETQVAATVTGIRNVWIKVQRSEDFKQKVQPLLSIGVLNKYPMGRGGILVNEMQINDADSFDTHRKQKRILRTLMHNLLELTD